MVRVMKIIEEGLTPSPPPIRHLRPCACLPLAWKLATPPMTMFEIMKNKEDEEDKDDEDSEDDEDEGDEEEK